MTTSHKRVVAAIGAAAVGIVAVTLYAQSGVGAARLAIQSSSATAIAGAVQLRPQLTRLQVAGWPRGIAPPGLPQIRTCPSRASGSSSHGFAARVVH